MDAPFTTKISDSLGRAIRTRVRHGMLEPLEEICLPEGSVITVALFGIPAPVNEDAFFRAAGKWKRTVDAETLIRNVSHDRLTALRSAPML